MAYIVTSVKYASHIGVEVGKKYLEALQKFPPGKTPGKVIIQAAVRGTTDGIRVFSITQVKDEEFVEAWRYIGNMMALFLEVEGLEYMMEVWAEVQEALESVGLKLP
ncbi:MAG: hypothetical protein ACW986_11220 [Promethearchaeota archaeon]|jgi:hypothetical protein